MTRTDIAISLKPLNWMEYELDNGDPVLSADYDGYTAYIEGENDGAVTLTIICMDEPIPDDKYTNLTMQEAKDIARLHQVDSFCEYFNLDDK